MCEIPKKKTKSSWVTYEDLPTCKCGAKYRKWKTTDNMCPKCKIKALQSKKDAKHTKLPFQVQKFNSVAKTKPKRQKTEKQKAKANAWTWFSRYIRLSNSVNGQYVICYTCGTPHGIKEVDAGHFITRSKDSVLFNENNCKPQCRKCNRFQQGRSYDFEVHLIEDIGIRGVDALKGLAKFTQHFTTDEFDRIGGLYKLKVNQLQQEYGVKLW